MVEKEITSVVFSVIKHEFTEKAIDIYMKAINNYQNLEGCNGIELFVSHEGKNKFMVISKWINIEYRDKYMKSEFHIKSVEKLKKYRERDPVFKNFYKITD